MQPTYRVGAARLLLMVPESLATPFLPGPDDAEPDGVSRSVLVWPALLLPVLPVELGLDAFAKELP